MIVSRSLRRRFAWPVVTLVCGLGTLVAAGSAIARTAVDRYTPVVMSVHSTPHWFTGADGRVHLVYELMLTNGFPVPITTKSVVVSNGLGGRRVQRLSGAGLKATMSPLDSPGTAETKIPGSSTSVVWFDIALRNRRALPRTVVHTLTVSVPPGLPVPRTITDTGGAARVDLRPPVTLGPPLRGPGWAAVGSCCDGPHRRALQPINGALRLGQRFAVDWNGFDAHRRFVVGDPDVNSSWIFFDKPVIAVADARVVATANKFPDQIPNHAKPVTLPEADGNYIILSLGHGRYAGYAHLVPGSVRVKPGQRVKRGQLLAALGNSGSSSGPHLHFQVMNAPSLVDSDGLPFVINRFRFLGRIPLLTPELETTINQGKPVSIDAKGRGARSDELPLGRDAVDFAP